MQFLVLAVVCSVVVSILLKIARKQSVVLEQAIFVNYITATTLSFFLLKPNFTENFADNFSGSSTYILLVLGLLLPIVFIIMGRAVDYAGIVRSDAAQRLSLFLPIIAAITIFGEKLVTHTMVGVVLAFVALVCLLLKPDTQNNAKNGSYSALLLVGVWFGYGIIDILFKQLSRTQFTNNLIIMFVLAGVIMFAYIILRRQKWHVKSLLGGIILGVFNFYNILFYIKAHGAFSGNPTFVFASMNMGVIILGALVGLLVFKEKLRPINMVGLLLAILSIIMLYYGQTLFN